MQTSGTYHHRFERIAIRPGSVFRHEFGGAKAVRCVQSSNSSVFLTPGDPIAPAQATSPREGFPAALGNLILLDQHALSIDCRDVSSLASGTGELWFEVFGRDVLIGGSESTADHAIVQPVRSFSSATATATVPFVVLAQNDNPVLAQTDAPFLASRATALYPSGWVGSATATLVASMEVRVGALWVSFAQTANASIADLLMLDTWTRDRSDGSGSAYNQRPPFPVGAQCRVAIYTSSGTASDLQGSVGFVSR